MAKRYGIGCGMILMLLLCLSACRGRAPEPSRSRLEARIQGFISARQARDRMSLQQYYLDQNQARVGNIIYQGSQVKSIKIEGLDAVVELRNDFRAMGFSFKDVPQKMRWQWNKNDWFVVVKAGSNPFARKQGARSADEKENTGR